MKAESSSSSTSNNIPKMAFDMYPSISGKQDPVREVFIKYLDYFLPDASGTSAVAIDNKIEQAMDLVKSHLMIAVREEVEVLKERISELMDKINQLEVENTILKANISQETLQQLQLQTQLQIAGSASSTAAAAGNNMLTAPPPPPSSSTSSSASVSSSSQTTVATATTAAGSGTAGTTAAVASTVQTAGNATTTVNNAVNTNAAEATVTQENVNAVAAVNVNNANTTAASAADAVNVTVNTSSINAANNGPMP